ncbi:class II aldolase/adducin family protein [Bacillus sp. Marseille-P3661]|uniref:class II aldolase/adducin family protein n=1 Tax=Bacillus sp. Marseille-P3661 TaxID=1936234 RepID=UPI000C844855|nr:class II aldolase/adducin family protein [Bacillus sp. Marseille-P3661]
MIESLKEKVALSCRILAMEGLVAETLGHVSVRIPNKDEMLIRCRGEHEEGVLYTQKETVRCVNFDGEGEDLAGKYEVPKELPIHGEIYKARPEVNCVIHAHPPATLICGISDIELKPIFGAFNIPAMRMALEGIPIFPRSYLVTTPNLALPMIEMMGDKDVCLMKGHGITVTGKSVEEATIRALNFNALAQITLEIEKTGKKAQVISKEDIEELPDLGSKFNDQWVWRHYVRKLRQFEGNH